MRRILLILEFEWTHNNNIKNEQASKLDREPFERRNTYQTRKLRLVASRLLLLVKPISMRTPSEANVVIPLSRANIPIPFKFK
jgi:hypothetical protein